MTVISFLLFYTLIGYLVYKYFAVVRFAHFKNKEDLLTGSFVCSFIWPITIPIIIGWTVLSPVFKFCDEKYTNFLEKLSK